MLHRRFAQLNFAAMPVLSASLASRTDQFRQFLRGNPKPNLLAHIYRIVIVS